MPQPAIFVINAGSSSLKYAIYPVADLAASPPVSGQYDGLGTPHARFRPGEGSETLLPAQGSRTHQAAIEHLLDWLAANHAGLLPIACGHRIVHGGTRHSAPCTLDEETLAQLDTLTPLAPLHQPHNLRAVHACRATLPDAVQVACFDTAFHHNQPALARHFALPRDLTDAGIQRYGFHGLSYEHVSNQLPTLFDQTPERVIAAHLGNGASLCAMLDGRSVATTMGFTAVDGLMMGTRSGCLDPGVLLYLMDEKGYDSAQLSHLLYHESGLLGVSGISSDLRDLLASEKATAAEAIDLFCYRIIREIGSLAAALGGVDALVFTGGIGEHAADIRRRIVEGCAWLGASLSAEANAHHESRLECGASKIAIARLAADEEGVIARHTARLALNA